MSDQSGDTSILVVYYSRFGAVRALADEIAAGARDLPGTRVELLEVESQAVDELREGETPEDRDRRWSELLDRLTSFDAMVVGAPAYFGGMASPVKRLLRGHRGRQGWAGRREPGAVVALPVS